MSLLTSRRPALVAQVFAATQQAGVTPDEPSWSGMVRLFSLRGDLGRATATLDQMVAQQIKPKLRSVAPFLAAACERGDLGLATQAAPSHSRPTLACLDPTRSPTTHVHVHVHVHVMSTTHVIMSAAGVRPAARVRPQTFRRGFLAAGAAAR